MGGVILFNFGMVLHQLRLQHGYSQSEVANKLNVTHGTIGRWENNSSTPSTEKLIELSILYNIPLNHLIGVPMKETLYINSLSPDKQNLMQAIAAEFKQSPKDKVNGKYSKEQQQILNALFEEFNSH